jgi:hypothetical protein
MEINPQPHRPIREDLKYAAKLMTDFAADVWDTAADELMPWVVQALYALAYLDMLRARIAIRRSRADQRP